jgi:hypothetical protein
VGACCNKKTKQKNRTYQSTGGVESTTLYNCVYNRRDETDRTKFVVCENPLLVKARKCFSYKGIKLNAAVYEVNFDFRERQQNKEGTHIVTRRRVQTLVSFVSFQFSDGHVVKYNGVRLLFFSQLYSCYRMILSLLGSVTVFICRTCYCHVQVNFVFVKYIIHNIKDSALRNIL